MMGFLTSCCCCCSIRQGSIVSAKYTLVYFALFSLLSGSMLIQDILNWSISVNDLPEFNRSSIKGTLINEKNRAKNFKVTTPSGVINLYPPTQAGSKVTTDSSIVHPFEAFNNYPHKHPEEFNDHYAGPFELDNSTDIPWTIILGLDFTFEVAGIISSLLLLFGLKKEKKCLLIPWLIVVPCHIVLDACQAVNIMVESCSAEPSHECNQSLSSILFVIVDLILNLISAYVFLIVLSQYQNYRAGRGTAAYDGLMARNSDASNYILNPTSINSSHRNSQSQSNRRSYGLDKSDIWCDDFMLDRLNSSPPKSSLTASTGKDKDRNVTTSLITPNCKGQGTIQNSLIINNTRDDQIVSNKDTNQKTEQNHRDRRDSKAGHSVRFDNITIEEDGNSVEGTSAIKLSAGINNSKCRRNSDKGSLKKSKFDLLSVSTSSNDTKSRLKVPNSTGRRSTGSIKTDRSGSPEESSVSKIDFL